MRAQLDNTSDITREQIVTAPATKHAMRRKERELMGVDHLFTLPVIEGLAPELIELFTRNLTTEEFVGTPEEEQLPARDEEQQNFAQVDDYGIVVKV
jgi:hypothetical protein